MWYCNDIIMMSFIDTLLHIDHIEYFYIFVCAFTLAYFLLGTGVYLYVYKLQKYQLKRFKIQRDEPPLENIWWNIKWSTITMGVWVIVAYVLVLLINNDHTQVYANISDYGIPYFIFTIILFAVLHDTYYYWAHRFMHSHDIVYKYAHSVHHTTMNPTPFSIFAFSPIEALLLGFYFVLICLIIPIHIYAVIAVFMINSFANIIGHLGYEFLGFTLSKRIDKFFINSIHHNTHHKYGYLNYSIYFPYWDTIMKTLHPKYEEEYEAFYAHKKNE
jgi:Delta7-sterol 5-desaturase